MNIFTSLQAQADGTVDLSCALSLGLRLEYL